MTATKHPVPKICLHCQKAFVARRYVTKYCSLRCAQQAYKERERESRVKAMATQKRRIPETDSRVEAKRKPQPPDPLSNIHLREIIDIIALSKLTGISQRTIYRMLKMPGFPYLRIRKLLRFHKTTTISFISKISEP